MLPCVRTVGVRSGTLARFTPHSDTTHLTVDRHLSVSAGRFLLHNIEATYANLDDCILAATGAGGGTTFLAFMALAGIILGMTFIVVSRKRGANRGVISGLVALAILGSVIVVPLIQPSSAQAAGDRRTECPSQEPMPAAATPTHTPSAAPTTVQPTEPTVSATTPSVIPSATPTATPTVTPTATSTPTPSVTPTATPTPVVVTPVAPTLSEVECGIKPEVVLPTTPGVVYAQSEDGNTVTVTATAAEGYVLAPGSVTSFTLDVTPKPCACVPEDIPEFNESDFPVTGYVGNGFAVGLPEAWLAGLAEREAIFTSTTAITQTTKVLFGYNDPVSDQSVELGTKDYSTNFVTTGSESTISGPGSLSFANVTTSGQPFDIEEAVAADVAEFQTQYPDAEILYFGVEDSITETPSLTVTAKGDCGEDQVKEYPFEPRTSGGGGGLSDIRVKTNVTLVGSVHGFNIYSWNYTFDPSGQKYVGVIAQEVMKTNPDSVYVAGDGYYRVRYDVLGLRMLTLEQYEAGKSVLAPK